MYNMRYTLRFACSYSQHMQTIPAAAVQLLNIRTLLARRITL